MKTLPATIGGNAFELEAAAQIDLYEMTLSDGIKVFFCPVREVTWQGNTYSEIPCHLSQISFNSDGTRNRPKFSFSNPAGLFSAYIMNGLLEGGTLERHRALWSDVQADQNIALHEKYRMSQIINITQKLCVVELRTSLDAAVAHLPTRAFYPPEFPHVRLG